MEGQLAARMARIALQAISKVAATSVCHTLKRAVETVAPECRDLSSAARRFRLRVGG
jgi:hypothetical protein